MRALSVLLLAACDPEVFDSGAGEPFRVRGATFHPGDLPEDPGASTPRVTNAGGLGGVATAGQANLPYSGLATPDGLGVAVALAGVSTGYWVASLGPPDVTQGGELTFDLVAELGDALVPGLYTLAFTAVDAEDRPGPRYEVPLCVLADHAEFNLAVCDVAFTPQHTVLSLSWDTDVDLDLVVVAPSGKVVRAKTPTTGELVGLSVPNATVADPTTGRLSRDSNGGCHVDGIRRESLIFVEPPPPGEYRVYASLHATCGEPHVNWSLTGFQRQDAEDAPYVVARTDLAAGSLLPVHADGGASLGTWAATLNLP